MSLIYLSQRREWNHELVEPGKEAILIREKDFNSDVDSAFVIRKIKFRFLPFYSLRVTFGPAINFNEKNEFEKMLMQLKRIAKEEKAVFLEFNPYVWDLDLNHYNSAAEKFGFIKAENYVYRNSIIVDLAPTEEEIFKQFERRGQKAIRQSETRGVKVEKVELNAENFDKFFSLYKNTCQRTAFIPEKYEVLNKQMLFWGKREGAILFFAYDESEFPIGALLLFNNDDSVSTVYQGNNYEPEIINKRASNALYWQSLKWAKAKGFRYFDFGGITVSDPGNADEKKEGIQNFKTQFGGKVVTLPGNYRYINRKAAYKILKVVLPVYSRFALRLAKMKAFGK